MKVDVLHNKRLSGLYYKMRLSCPELTDEVKPGHFLMLKVNPGYEPYLRRPFSFYGMNSRSEQPSFEILYKVVGLGTGLLAEMKPGVKVDIIAPLGNAFSLSSEVETVILVAGGIGVAPLVFFVEDSKRNRKKTRTIFLYGGKSKADIVDVERIRNACSDLRICTEDGSMGSRMLATELLEEYLKKLRNSQGVEILSCGPNAMLKGVSGIAASCRIPCQVSLESYMACGFGACLGCVVKVRREPSVFAYERVCKEGPVFNSERVVWDG